VLASEGRDRRDLEGTRGGAHHVLTLRSFVLGPLSSRKGGRRTMDTSYEHPLSI
jgi:hypothetical protein